MWHAGKVVPGTPLPGLAPQPTQWGLSSVAGDGDVLGLLLDCDAGSLTLYLNGVLKGVMVKEGQIR